MPLNSTHSQWLRWLLPPAAILLCLLGAAMILAFLGSPPQTEQPPSFIQSLKLIATEIHERVLLPRHPKVPSGYRNWVQTLQTATPLLLAGLAITVAFRAGVLNIGAQGQYIAGAIGTTVASLHLPIPSSPLLITMHLLCAAALGALLAAIAALLCTWRKVPVVLSTLLLNFVALEFLRYLLQGPLRARSEAGALLDPMSPPLPEAARLPEFLKPAIGQGFGSGIIIALVCAILLGLFLRWTVIGFRLRVTGANPEAARFAGMNVARVSIGALALSGALAGMAGGVRIAGTPAYILNPDLGTDAVGFTAIAVALLGGLHPLGVIAAALFFGMLTTAFGALERSPLQIHHSTAQAVQGALILAILISTRLRTGAASPA